MYTNVSSAFKSVHNGTGRHFCAKMELSSGITFPNNNCEVLTLKHLKGNSSANDITFGDVSSSVITAELTYHSSVMSVLKDGMTVNVSIGLQLSNSVENVPVGEFTVQDFARNGEIIKINLADRLYNSDSIYSSNLVFPNTADNVVKEICNELGITSYVASGINLAEMAIPAAPDNITKRQMLSYIASYFGQNVYLDRNGQLVFGWYDYSYYRPVSDDYIETPTLGEKVEITALGCAVDSEKTLVSGTGRALTFVNPYMTQSRLDSLRRDISYTPAEINMLVGNVLFDFDVLQYGDAIIPIMSSELNFDGGVSLKITASGKTAEDAEQKTVTPTDLVLKQAKKYAYDMVKHATDIMNGVNGGYRIERYDADGNPYATLWLNAPDEKSATNCIMINKEGVAFGQKNAGSEDWTFTQAWLIDGTFNTKFITTHNLELTGKISDTKDGTAIDTDVENHYQISADLEIPTGIPEKALNAAGLEVWGKEKGVDAKSRAFYTNWGTFFNSTSQTDEFVSMLNSFITAEKNNYFSNTGFFVATRDADGNILKSIAGTPDGGFVDNGKRCLTEETGLMLENAPVFNVIDYGMSNSGNFAVNDILNNIIIKANEYGGGTIFFPSGTYWFNSSVTFGSNIRILGDVNTVFTAEPPNTISHGLRHSTFFEIGTVGAAYYNGFSNVEINNIIFDLGGYWKLDGSVLTYRAKYDTRHKHTSSDYLSYCPIVACHGENLRIKNCTFKNGVYAGYTGASGNSGILSTNPHIFDIGGVKDILIENCIFGTVLATATSMLNWVGGYSGETGQHDVNYSDMIQLDAAYSDGGNSSIKGQADGTNCKNIVIRNNKFYGLPYFDWKNVINDTTDAADGKTKESDKLLSAPRSDGVLMNYSQFRFAKYAAVGTCHLTGTNSLSYQPDNVEIYDNYFEHSWSSHYCCYNASNTSNSYESINGVNYPIVGEYYEPARKFCHGAIYAYPGAKNYNIHNNVFRETLGIEDNKSTAVFLYGSEAGIVHNNIFINYGQPLPIGTKSEKMSNIVFSDTDDWSASKIGYYNGLTYCKSNNNLWIKDNEAEKLDVFNGAGCFEFDVKNFGALGDGTTDDSTAIQKAINACNESGGRLVYFPSGKYLLKTCVYYYSNMMLFFEQGAALLRGRSNLRCLLSNYVSSTATGYDGTENVRIIGATFDGNSSFSTTQTNDNKVTLLLTRRGKNISVENCTFKNGNVWHLYEVNAAENVKIINCIFDGSNYGGTTSQIDGYAELLQLDNDYNAPGVVSETLVTSGDLTPCKNIHIKGCKFICNGYTNAIGNHNAQIYKHSQIRISDCYFTGGGGTGGYIDFDSSTIEVDVYNNTFDDQAVNITASSSNSTIHDNRIDNVTTAYAGSFVAYCNLINGSLDAKSSDDTIESIDFDSFGSMRNGDSTYGYATLASANIRRYKGRIMGSLKFNDVTTNSAHAFLPVKVNEEYRPKLTCLCVAENNTSSSGSTVGIGYLSSNSETLRVTFAKALSAVDGVTVLFDYAL